MTACADSRGRGLDPRIGRRPGYQPGLHWGGSSRCLTQDSSFRVARRNRCFYGVGSTLVSAIISVAVASAIREPLSRFSMTAVA